MSLTAVIDYESGNLHSAEKAFQRMAQEVDAGEVVVTSDPEVVAKADRLVLPGDGAFPACWKALFDHRGIFEAVDESVNRKGRPFMGICVGMQMLASVSREYVDTDGFDWIGGEVVRITPADPTLKVPHMGWNDLVIDNPHPVLKGVATGITPISCTRTICRSPTRRTFWRIATMRAISPPSLGATISSARNSTRKRANPPDCA